MRWCRGYLQILKRYTFKLLGGFFSGRGFSHFDVLMSMSPAFFISVAMVLCNIIGFAAIPFVGKEAFVPALLGAIPSLVGSYFLFFLVGLLTTIYEWDRIRTSTAKKIWFCVTFPVFMATYIPIAACSFFMHAKWKPVKHNPVDENEFNIPHDDGEQ